MLRLTQPGPAPPQRIVARAGKAEEMEFALAAGQSLNAALTGPLVLAGFRSGAAVFEGAVLAPFRYYLPGPSADGAHAAWFAGPHEAAFARVETANATFGWRDGAPYVHCHAVWIEPDGNELSQGRVVIVQDADGSITGSRHGLSFFDEVTEQGRKVEIGLKLQRRLQHATKLGWIFDRPIRHLTPSTSAASPRSGARVGWCDSHWKITVAFAYS